LEGLDLLQRFRSINAYIRIGRRVGCKNKGPWKKTGICMFKKLKRIEVELESKVKVKE
jgi:hypothetical protein